ncbi:hypothetical protein LT875_002428 [Salmonella enterica]|nr:hypothetical protein [Salmonella enterica]
MKTMLERLLGHLHRAVFDTSADEIVAFRLDGPPGSSWVAVNELFTITFANGSEKVYDLNQYAIYQFIDELKSIGMTVTSVNTDCLYFSCITMLELNGKAGGMNPVTLYKDILHAIFGAYSREMRKAQESVTDAIQQMEIPTADDGFLDEWGTLFSVIRTPGMDDPTYRKKIRRVAFRKRVNSYAIEQVVKEDTGYTITLEEPWRDIFRLDISQLSGTHKFYKTDSDPNNPNPVDQTGYFLVQPVAYNAVDWDVIIPIIKRNLAAGINILTPAIRGMFIVDDPLDGSIWYQTWSTMSQWVKTDSTAKLDNDLMLSGKYELPVNYKVSIDSTYAVFYFTPVAGLIRRDNSHLHSTSVIWGPVPVYTYFTGNKLGDWLQMYPVEPRTWMIGKWDDGATWKAPYTWAVYSRASANESAFLVADVTEDKDGNVISVKSWLQPQITSQMVEGWTWEDPDQWSSDRWDKGAPASYYIKAAPAVPANAGKFKLDSRGLTTIITVEHELKDGPMRIVVTRYDESTDQAVSGGMAQSIGRNSDNNVAKFTQEANGYAWNMTPISLGTTSLTVADPNTPGVKLVLNVRIVERLPWTDATTPATTTIPWTPLEPAPVIPWTPIDAQAETPATSVTIPPMTGVDVLVGLHHDAYKFTTVPPNARGYTTKWEVVDSLGMPYPAGQPNWITLNSDTGEWVMSNLQGAIAQAFLKLTLTNKDGTKVSASTPFYSTRYVLSAIHHSTQVTFNSAAGGNLHLDMSWQPFDAFKNEDVLLNFEFTDSAGHGVLPALVGVTYDRFAKVGLDMKGGTLHLTFPKGIAPGTYRGWIWPTYKNIKGGKFSFVINIR